MDPASECVSIGIRRNLPSPHRWHGDVPRVQREPVASAEAGHQRQLSKWLVGCAGLYRRGHAKRQRPYYWMRELPVPSRYSFASAVLPDGRVVVIGGEYNNLVPRVDQHRVHVRSSGEHMVSANNCAGTWCCAGGGGTGAIGDAQSTILTNGTMLLANIGNTGYRVVQSRDADLQCTRPDGQGRHQQRGRLESTAERDIPDCRFKDPNVLRNLRFRDQLVGDRRIHRGEPGRYWGGHSQFQGGRTSGPAAGWHAYRLLWHEFRSERRLQHRNRHVGCNWRGRETSRPAPGRAITLSPMGRLACCRMATCS